MRVYKMIVSAGVLLLATPSFAQNESPDFLFGAPRGSVTIRGGFRTASTNSDVYDFMTDTLTIEPSDFHSPLFGFDVAIAIHPRLDAIFGMDYSKASIESEYRDFVEDDDTPITQMTEFSRFPLTASLKLYLGPRGRSISRFAFIPSKVRPYIGGGGGIMRYKLLQSGDFVDFNDLSIFTGQFTSSGWGGTFHAFGGAEIRLAPKYYLSIEGRYVWGQAALSGDFVGFDPIDLSGFQTTAGLQISF